MERQLAEVLGYRETRHVYDADYLAGTTLTAVP